MAGTGVNAGRDAKLYYNDRPETDSGGAGTYDTPVWVLIDRVGDVDRAGSKATTEVDMRASETTIVVYGNKSREITFTYYKRKGSTDAVYDVLLDSFENNTVLDIAMAEDNIATSGTVYDRGPFIVAEMSKSEPIAGVESYDVTMNFADTETDTPGTPFLYLPGQVTA
jgi:hypothetical protein